MFRIGGSEDPFKEFERYCRDRAQNHTLFGGSNFLVIRELRVNKDRRLIDGLVLHGQSGVTQDLVNITSGDVKYRKGKDQAALEPSYFCLRLDDGRRYGVAMLQHYGQSGIKGLLDADMSGYFGTESNNMTIDFTQLVDAQAVEKFARLGSLRDVVLINNGESASSRTALMRNSVGGDSLARGDKLEMHFKKRGGWNSKVLKKIVDTIRAGESPAELVTAPGMPGIDEIRVDVAINGRVQRFNILNAGDTPIRYDITSLVSKGADGYPTLDSLRRAATRVYQNSIIPTLE
jgi:hypothetical protein